MSHRVATGQSSASPWSGTSALTTDQNVQPGHPTSTIPISLFIPPVQVLLVSLLPWLSCPLPVQLSSQLPPQPIEEPAAWAWGSHPNGLGYQAANHLLYQTCLPTPDSPLCYNAATFFQCTRKSEEARKIKKTCMCAKHISDTKCTSIGALSE